MCLRTLRTSLSIGLFANKYGDRGLIVLGVAMDDDGWTSVRPYVEKMKMSYLDHDR